MNAGAGSEPESTNCDDRPVRDLAGADEATLIRVARDDQAAFGILYERYVERIYSYVYYRTGNTQEAEDLTARVFFRALQHIGRYEDQGVPFSAWLYRIARNLLSNWYRDQSRRQVISLEGLDRWHIEGSPELATELLEDKEALLAAVRHLPAERQELLILKFVERLPNAEIGQIMERSEGAVKSLYHRTLLSLRDDLVRTSQRQEATQRKRRRRWLHFRKDGADNNVID